MIGFELAQLGLLARTPLLRERAAGVEGASGRAVDGAGHVAGQSALAVATSEGCVSGTAEISAWV